MHRATLAEALERFGHGSLQRRAAAQRLNRIYQLVASTGQLARFIIFGSFVTAKPEPNDVDIVVLMENTFDLDSVTGEAAVAFQHMEAAPILEPASSGRGVWARLAGSRQ